MTELDIAIKQAEDMAKLNEAECFEYAEEYRQLVSWLKELKELREQKRPHGEWVYDDRSGQFICSECEGGVNMPTLMGEPLYKWCPWCGASMRKDDEE